MTPRTLRLTSPAPGGFRQTAPAWRLGLVLLAVVLVLPARADACPVCFGAADSPLLDSARTGVLAMVAFTVCILAAFGAWFLRLRRLAAIAEVGPPIRPEAR